MQFRQVSTHSGAAILTAIAVVLALTTVMTLNQPGAQASDDTLTVQMQLLQPSIDFELAAPALPSDFESGAPVDTGPKVGLIVQVRARSQQNPSQMIWFAQSAGGFGKIQPIGPSQPIQLHGTPTTLQVGENVAGDPMIQIFWDKGGISYLLAGYNLDRKSVVTIAESVTPIQ